MILVTEAGLAFLPALIRLLGAKENTFLYTQQYVQIILLGSFFTMGSYTIGALLRSEGSVRYSMTGMIAGTIINIALDQVIKTGTHILHRLMWILPFVGTVSMCRMSFQAMGKPIYAFCITLVRQLILYIPLLLVLNHHFGFHGMLWAQPVTEAIMMAVSFILLTEFIKRISKK